jgi:predicted DNA-binding protein with PD1-like motif
MMADTQHVHVHLVIAYRSDSAPNGFAVAAGHVSRGVAYGVEFIMTAYDGKPVERAIHARTGLNLWKLPTINL